MGKCGDHCGSGAFCVVRIRSVVMCGVFVW